MFGAALFFLGPFVNVLITRVFYVLGIVCKHLITKTLLKLENLLDPQFPILE